MRADEESAVLHPGLICAQTLTWSPSAVRKSSTSRRPSSCCSIRLSATPLTTTPVAATTWVEDDLSLSAEELPALLDDGDDGQHPGQQGGPDQGGAIR